MGSARGATERHLNAKTQRLSPLSRTAASTYPERLEGRKGQEALAATFSDVEKIAALAARESTQNAMKLKVSTAGKDAKVAKDRKRWRTGKRGQEEESWLTSEWRCEDRSNLVRGEIPVCTTSQARRIEKRCHPASLTG